MRRCQHEQGENPLASGQDNRRRNRDRLIGEIDAYNFLRHMRARSRPSLFDMRPGRSVFDCSLYPGPRGPHGFPGVFRPGCPHRSRGCSDDDFDPDDDESSSPWRPPPSPFPRPGPFGKQSSPPWSDICGSGRGYGNSRGGYYDDYADDGYEYMPRRHYPGWRRG